MTGFLVNPVIHHQIAADIARRNAQHARRADEHMRVILANAAAFGHGSLRRGPGVGVADFVAHRLEHTA